MLRQSTPGGLARMGIVAAVVAMGALSAAVPKSIASPGHPRNASRASGALVFVPIRVLVSAGANPVPLEGAEVRLVSQDRTIASGRTYNEGLAIAFAWKNGRGLQRTIPRHFTVQTSGGRIAGKRFRGSLIAQVTRYGTRPLVVLVNPVTTLSAMYCQRHRRMTPNACNRRAKTFLGLAGGENLSVDLLGSEAFDGQLMLKDAGGARGLPRYLDELVSKMGIIGAVHSFHTVEPRTHVVAPVPGLVRLSAADRHKKQTRLRSLSSWWSALNGIHSALSLVEFVGGWDSSSSGGGCKGCATQLANINSALNQISSQLADLKSQVSALQTEVTLGDYSTLAADAATSVNAVGDAMSSYTAVTSLASEISCWPATGSTCSDPQAPSTVCATPETRDLTDLCIALGDLPLPADLPTHPYTNPNAPAAVQNSLIGQFMHETEVNPFTDSDLESLANQVAGGLGGGAVGTVGIWQFGSAYLASQSPFLGTSTDQEIQDLLGYYLSAYTAGLTMRAAWWAFDQDSQSTYSSSIDTELTDFQDLVAAMPSPLPGGTFLETGSGRMWSGQLGSTEMVFFVPRPSTPITLPYVSHYPDYGSDDAPNTAPGAVTPELPDGQTISDWSVAGPTQLEELGSDAASQTTGDQTSYFVKQGLFAGQILSNSAVGPSGANVTWPNGLSESDWNAATPCSLAAYTSTCVAPTWGGPGETSLWDLSHGDGIYTLYGGALSFATLYWRMPVSTGTDAECYYYPESGATALSTCAG